MKSKINICIIAGAISLFFLILCDFLDMNLSLIALYFIVRLNVESEFDKKRNIIKQTEYMWQDIGA